MMTRSSNRSDCEKVRKNRGDTFFFSSEGVFKDKMPHVFQTDVYACRLESHPCQWSGGCKRLVTIGLPMCWQHSRIHYGVKVGPSTIPGAGNGLFAIRTFAPREKLCPYGGRLLTQTQMDDLYPGKGTLAPYAEQISKTHYRDAACVRGLGSMANGMAYKKDSNAETFVSTDRVPWLRAIKRIPAGQEILNHYHSDYFRGDIHPSSTRYVRKRSRTSGHS